jgi:putative ABC transport system permease protein
MEGELDEEVRGFLEMAADEKVKEGMNRSEARRAVRLEMGSAEMAKHDVHAVSWGYLMETCWQDLRFALRMLRKAPGFMSVAVLTLALGIGANTAIFSVVYAVLLKPLPFPNSGQLVFLSEAKPQEGIPSAGVSYDNFTELQGQNHVFSELAGVTTHDLTLTGQGEPAEVPTAGVTPELFTLLETRPLLGRAFLPEEGKPGATAVVILSEAVWRERFAANANVIGSTVTLDHRPYTVAGVMPADPSILFSPRRIEFWIPVAQDPLFGAFLQRQDVRFLGVVGRMKTGISITQAQTEMDGIAPRLAEKFPAENSGWVIHLKSLQGVIVGDLRTALLVLLGAVGLVLLIACANISNLLLARATSRGKEIAVRMALGAGQARILRQLISESGVLGLLGGAAGVLLAYWSLHALASFLPEDIPQVNAIHIDATVLLFALALSILTSVIFGLAPAFFAAGSNVQATLKESASHSSEAGVRRFARSSLAVAEVAMAMVLLVAAGLLLRSFAALTSVNPGFDVAHLVKADIQLPQFQYSKPEQWAAFGDELLRRLQSQPGMRDCALGVPLPLNKQGFAPLPFDIMGHAPLPKGTPQSAHFVSISPAYFQVMRIPLLRGRTFNDRDISSAPNVTIISEAFAHRFFANENPLGKKLVFSFPPNPGLPREIVGIVGDVRDASVGEEPGPMMYVPFDQLPLWGGEAVVRTNLSAGSVAATIRHEVDEIDKDLPVTDVVAMSELIDASVAQPRFRTWLIGSFGAIALVLAAAGIFGVISYSVSRRTQEIGIRISLGATRRDVMRLVLSESARLVVIGVVVGIPIALGLGRFLSNLLYGIHTADLTTFTAVALLLIVVGILAAYVPARRAIRVDPLTALRYE